jgi:hypothetical protein
MADSHGNYEVFRDCLSATVLAKSTKSPTKLPKKRASRGQECPTAAQSRPKMGDSSTASAETDDPVELAEFIEVPPQLVNGAER